MPWYSLALVSHSCVFFNDYTCIMIGKMSLLYHFNTNIMEKSIAYTTCKFEGNGYMVLYLDEYKDWETLSTISLFNKAKTGSLRLMFLASVTDGCRSKTWFLV